MLLSVQHDGVHYHFERVLADGTHLPPDSYDPDIMIKTNRVIITKAARQSLKDSPTPNSASLTHRMLSTNYNDIATVLKAINE